MTLFFSNVSIYYSHVRGNFSDNCYTGNVHLKCLRVMVELPKCNSVQVQEYTNHLRKTGERSIHSFLVPYWCKLLSHCSVTDSKWVCTSLPVTRQCLIPDIKTSVCLAQILCSPHIHSEEWSITEQSYMDICSGKKLTFYLICHQLSSMRQNGLIKEQAVFSLSM